MGIERAVTRWYAQRQLILNKIAALTAQLAQAGIQEDAHVPTESEVAAQMALAKAQEELHSLGPCPKPMMG